MLSHLAAATCVVLATGFTVPDLGDLFGTGRVDLWESSRRSSPWSPALSLINAFNMLDGLDGLAGGAGMLALVGLATLGIWSGVHTTPAIAIGLVAYRLGATEPFLFYLFLVLATAWLLFVRFSARFTGFDRRSP